jgi:hypothetical protein
MLFLELVGDSTAWHDLDVTPTEPVFYGKFRRFAAPNLRI